MTGAEHHLKRRVDVGFALVFTVFLSSLLSLVLILTDFRGDNQRSKANRAVANEACRLANNLRFETNLRTELFKDRTRIQINVYDAIRRSTNDTPTVRQALRVGADRLRDLNRQIAPVRPFDCTALIVSENGE